MSDFYQWREQSRSNPLYQRLTENPVAYFCMEYATPKNLPIYAGGLGVLAGDFVIEARQQNFPLVALGIFYNQKCYSGVSGNYCIKNDPLQLGLLPVVDKLGKRVQLSMPVGSKKVSFVAWFYSFGTIPIYLLDTNISENDKTDREITNLLYVAEPEKRIKQELILGIGGTKLLKELGINPSIYHMNEGHSAFLVYELARQIMEKEGIDYIHALQLAKKKIAFTNHTLVVGGHDVFSTQTIKSLLTKYAEDSNLPLEEMLLPGMDKSNKKVYSTTFLALNSATRINAVSKLHSEEAKKHWPNYKTLNVTNGISIDRWDFLQEGEDIVRSHQRRKKDLLNYIKKETGIRWSEKDLVLAWARRIVSYKRPTAPFENLESIKKLVNNRREPLRLLYSGQPHYDDKEGHFLANQLRKLASDDLRGKMVFLEKYSTEISSLMISGADVWLNTPIVGLEACGTSGMKATLNGVLQCSTNDGWLPEVDLEKIGFKLDDKYVSLSLIDIISNHIVPLYYRHIDSNKVNSIWKSKMESSRETILHHFGSDRMLRDYIESVYRPILEEN